MKHDGVRPVIGICYDFTMAQIFDKAGVDMILVGDSGGRALLGHADNSKTTMDEMIMMSRAVVRGTEHAMVMADMPFMSYQVSVERALHNAGRFIREARVQCLKLEGNDEIADVCAAITRAGIPVQGHMGFTPMTSMAIGGFMSDDAVKPEESFRQAAFALQDAGCFSLMFTQVPPDTCAALTKELRIPTFAGAGSGKTNGLIVYSSLNAAAIDRSPDQYGVTAGRAVYDHVKGFVDDVRSGKVTR
jgi:3-methyl-2-oxobutanoate hydroxymethyltransferase